MTTNPDGLFQNSEGLFQYAESPVRHRAGRSKVPDTLAMVVLILTALPILLLFVFTALYLHSFITGTGAIRSQSVMFLPFVAAALGAVVTGVLLKCARTNRRAWVMSLCTITLLLAAVFPPAYSFSKG